jgi:hypothetical protein
MRDEGSSTLAPSDLSHPRTGVFATRSPRSPNLLGVDLVIEIISNSRFTRKFGAPGEICGSYPHGPIISFSTSCPEVVRGMVPFVTYFVT